jgi:hypothetical protein
MDGPLAVDAIRAARLRAAGYRVITRTIPDSITMKNRLLMGQPVLLFWLSRGSAPWPCR